MIQTPSLLEASERAELESAIIARSAEAVANAIEMVYDRLFVNGRFDDRLVSLLCELLARSDFLGIDGAWSAFTFVSTSFGDLTPCQLEAMGPYAEQAFARTSDPMMAFIMSEWLGEHIHSRASFEALVRLKASSGPETICLVPHGFEHIFRDAADPELKREALDQLHSMKDSPNVRVREEVQISLERLRTRGLIPSKPG